MKYIFETFDKTDKLTQKFLLFNLIFSLSIIACSLSAFYLAEYSGSYYTAKELSSELISALRACFTVISIGTVVSAHLAKEK